MSSLFLRWIGLEAPKAITGLTQETTVPGNGTCVVKLALQSLSVFVNNEIMRAI